MGRVYSYLRFSDPKQAAGSSVERQQDYARRWAAERGLVLDESLSLRDEGLSAYHEKHLSKGALGVFLAAIEAGRGIIEVEVESRTGAVMRLSVARRLG